MNDLPFELWGHGLATPISDRALLTVGHLGKPDPAATYLDDPQTDLRLVLFEPGTFREWATISLDSVRPGTGFETVIRREGIVTTGINFAADDDRLPQHFHSLAETGVQLQSGDSGGGVFSGGELIGVNYATSKTASYYIDVGHRAEWINGQLAPLAVPEPSVVAMIVLAVCLWAGWRFRR